MQRKSQQFERAGQRGTTLVDVMFATFLLAMAGMIFAATFPTGITCTRRAKDIKNASALAQKKIEQLRAVKYESLTAPLLLSAGLIDSTTDSNGYSFTTVDSVNSQLTNGTGVLAITDKSADVKQVVVTVSWNESASTTARNVTLRTYIADKRTRPAL